jgi:hypothetical protein
MEAHEFTEHIKMLIQHAVSQHEGLEMEIKTFQEAGYRADRVGLFVKIGEHEYEMAVSNISRAARFKVNDVVEAKIDPNADIWWPAVVTRVGKTGYVVQLPQDPQLGHYSGTQGSVLTQNVRAAGEAVAEQTAANVAAQNDPMDETAQQKGFTNAAELNTMVTNVDLTTPEKLKAFMNWKDNDGSKAGLIPLLKAE